MIDVRRYLLSLYILDFNLTAYHQYDNFKPEDYSLDFKELLTEYFQGSTMVSQVHNSRVRTAGTPSRERSSSEDQEYIKRFLQLKYAIMFLQKTKSIGRYCFYGNICFIEEKSGWDAIWMQIFFRDFSKFSKDGKISSLLKFNYDIKK